MTTDTEQHSNRLKNISNELESRYNHLLHALNISIAQQSLLSGDYLSLKIADIIFSNKHSDIRNRLIDAVKDNPQLANNVLIAYLDKHLINSRRTPDQNIDDVFVPGSSWAIDNSSNWATNLSVYQRLYLQKAEFLPSSSRWSKTKAPTSSSICNNPNRDWNEHYNWSCIFPNDLKIIDNVLFIEKLRERDGQLVLDDEVPLALPSPAKLETRQIAPYESLITLIQARDILLSYAWVLNTDIDNPEEFYSSWILPKGTLMGKK